MTLKEDVKKYLEVEPHFRERKNKDTGIVNLMLRRYLIVAEQVKRGIISKDSLVGMMQDYATMDRVWRQLLEENEALRGFDYGDKQKLEEDKQIALGYGPRVPFKED